ncbi:MAG: tryptophan--tRNA ligase, partial [Burkholderiales bacterium]
GKGLLNRAHAYKAAVDKNAAAGTEPDDGVTAGLFMYPVLMAADIVMFNAHKVPVGRDQVQHIEMTRDMASSFNHLYGEHFTLPEAVIDDAVALLPGLDGRKMSKSYDNVIALFAPPETIRRQISGIVTDSRAPGEPKEAEGSALFQIYQAFASEGETMAMRTAYAEGIGWGDAKQMLFERIDREIAPMRERYQALMDNPGELEDILQSGSEKARARATPFMAELRHAVGLRRLTSISTEKKQRAEKAVLPSFKQYVDDGKFRFKVLDPEGQLLYESPAFEAGRDAGKVVGFLKKKELHELRALLDSLDERATAGLLLDLAAATGN